ncbi:putative LOB domain-containing protein 38 [Hibiscus syriacus]|uniref:LOB domain-containing protein 38 n=1 Tax=Hibiscus syriacus TaxID=106335 RepID=A0A6A3ADX0_HIBSY|nr:putative LOB domain-containing protein 38 [Hibiscus syriacus]
MMITSRRSLFVSFQGEAFSLPISKIKAQEGSNLTRKANPERHRPSPITDHEKNSMPVDQGKTRKANSGSNSSSRSLDYGCDRNVFRSCAMLDESSSRSVSFVGPSDRRLSLDCGCHAEMFKEANKLKPNAVACDLAASDTNSLSSGREHQFGPASPSQLRTPSASSRSRGLGSAWVRNAVGDQMMHILAMEIQKCKGGCHFHDTEAECREIPVECSGDNIGTVALGQANKNQVAIAESKVETDFHPEGTNIENMKNAVSSAGAVMQAITSSTCTLSSKVEEMNSLVANLAIKTTKEMVLLEQCNNFLSALAAIQVKDCSLRSHRMQLNHVSN